MKKIYRTVIRYEILSEEPIGDPSLEEIARNCDEGDWSGASLGFELINEELSGESAVQKIKAQGSSPEFFNMDEKGNELDDWTKDYSEERDHESYMDNEESVLECIAEQIKTGYTSGINPNWNINYTIFESGFEMGDADYEHVAQQVLNGMVEGELCISNEEQEESRGWWKFKLH